MNNLVPPSLRRLIPYYLLLLAVVICYSNVYDNTFLYDDEYLIQRNDYLRSWHSLGDIFTNYLSSGAHRLGRFYRPLQNVLYLIIYQFSGPTLFGFHLLNIVLHATNACLVYALGRRLNFNAGAVFFATLIWTVHPIHTEAVTYMSGTADMLYVTFALLGLNVLVPEFTRRQVFIATGCMLLALLSKETAITFPLLAMTCLYLVKSDRLNPKTYLCTWPLWALTGFYLFIRFGILTYNGAELLNIDPTSQAYGTHIDYRIYTALTTLPAYLALMLWPVDLHMDRDFPVYSSLLYWETWIGIFMVIAAIAQIIWSKGKRGLPISWSLLWFATIQIPQTGILVPVNSLFLEHWMYMPSIGLALGFSQGLTTALSNRAATQILSALAIFLVVLLGWRTHEQNKLWHDPFVFYANILDHGETSVRARNNLGIAYMNLGDYPHAMAQFQRALKDHDMTPETHQNIASVMSKMPGGGPAMVREEIVELEKAIKIDPTFQLAYESLSSLYAYLGDKEKEALYREKSDELRRLYVP